jgi:hypothetical protein
MFSMFHASGIDTIGGSFVSKFEESPLGDNVGGVGGWNRNPRLINLLANLLSESKSCHLFFMKP